MIRFFYCFFLLLFSVALFGQNNSQVQLLINETETSIYKTQKEMLRTGDFSLIEKLSLAVKFQLAAVSEFNKSNMEKSADYTIQSRDVCLDILKSFQLAALDKYEINNSENQFRKKLELDKNAFPINLEFLKDPSMLSAEYKLNVN